MNPYLKKSVMRALESGLFQVIGLLALAFASPAMFLGNGS